MIHTSPPFCPTPPGYYQLRARSRVTSRPASRLAVDICHELVIDGHRVWIRIHGAALSSFSPREIRFHNPLRRGD